MTKIKLPRELYLPLNINWDAKNNRINNDKLGIIPNNSVPLSKWLERYLKINSPYTPIFPIVTDNGDGTVSHDDGNGTIVTFGSTATLVGAPTLNSNILTFTQADGTTSTIDLSLYLDDTNLARLVSGTLDINGIATFTRDDATTFTVDFSPLFDDTNLARITSGAVVGTDLILTRDDATTITIDITSLLTPNVNNGLNINGTSGDIHLGGTLIENTVIDGAGNNMIVNNVTEFELQATDQFNIDGVLMGTIGSAVLTVVGNNMLVLSGITETRLLTPNIATNSATIGQVLTLQNAITGEVDWQNLPAGGDNTRDEFTGITGTTVTLSATPVVGTIEKVFRNGVLQFTSNYTLVGTTLTFTAASLIPTDEVVVIYTA